MGMCVPVIIFSCARTPANSYTPTYTLTDIHARSHLFTVVKKEKEKEENEGGIHVLAGNSKVLPHDTGGKCDV